MPHDDQKKAHGDNNAQDKNNGLKQPGKQPNEHKHGENYASKMWHKIEGAVAKDKISGLKQEFGGQNVASAPWEHKRRHRRRRKKKHGGETSGVAMPKENIQVKQPPTEPVQHKEMPQTPVTQYETMPSVTPISPFAQPEVVPPAPFVETVSPFDLPPKNYEPTIKAKLKKEKEKKEEAKEEMVERMHDLTDTSKEDVIPINPFEMEPSAKPLDTKALDEKPLDQVGKAPKVEAAFYEEIKSPFDQGEAETTNVKEISNEPAMEGKDMPHSNKEIIDVTPEDQNTERKIEPVFPENIDNGNGEFKEDLWTILEQAGITKKKAFVILISLILVVIVGLFFLFGGYKIFQSDGGGGGDIVSESAEESPYDVVVTPEESSESEVTGLTPYSIISSYIFGLKFTAHATPIEAEPISSFGDISGVTASFVFGEIGDLKAEQFVEYVRLTEKMNNIYNVDVYSLVDLATDRRRALDDYLKEMDDLIQQGLSAVSNIEADLQVTDAQYEATNSQNEQYEALFFQYLQNFYGQTAYDTLQTFIDSSHESVRLKAEYRAKNTLRTMLVNSLNLLRPKYKDVAANTEALIKGVKVFDVPKSDIDAIIPLE